MSDRTDRRSQIGRRVESARAAIENLRPLELLAELRSPSCRTVLLDVRSADECRAGVIEGARIVPRGTIETSIAVHTRPDARVVLYCDTGDRSALSALALYELGYRDVAHLDRGLTAWREAGLTTTLPASPAPRCSEAGED